MKLTGATADTLTEHWDRIRRHLGRQPCWSFPDQIRGDGLHLRRLDFDNMHEVLRLFINDPTPYVDARFREEDQLFEYVLHLLAEAAYSAESGGVDYLIVDVPGQDYPYEQFDSSWLKNQHDLPEAARFVGVAHLYDLRHTEDMGHNIYPPKAGLMIGRAYRGRGIGQRAMGLLQEYVRRNHQTDCLQVEIEASNTASREFFNGLGYRPVRSDDANTRLQLTLR